MTAQDIFITIFVGLVYFGGAIYMVYDPETIGSATGYMGHGYVGTATPPGMVRFAGCAMLALPAGLIVGALWWPLGVLGGLAVAIGLYHVAGRVWPL